MKKIQNSAALFFIFSVAILTAVSIFGVWDFLKKDVITKSFETLGLLAVIAVVITVAGRFFDKGQVDPNFISVPNPIFPIIRRLTVGILIVSAVLLAFTGVAAIWDLITDKDVLHKSISSLAILAFSTFIVIIMCLEREDSKLIKGANKNFSIGRVFAVLFIIFAFFWIIGILSSGMF